MVTYCPHTAPILDGYPPSPPPECHHTQPPPTPPTAFTGSDMGPFLGVTLVLALLGAGLLRAIRKERGDA